MYYRYNWIRICWPSFSNRIFKKTKCKITQKILERNIIGFDTNLKRLEELKNGFDSTNEVSKQELLNTNFFELTNSIELIAQADVFIITVPTPIDALKKPDLSQYKKPQLLWLKH